MNMEHTPLLQIDQLDVVFDRGGGAVPATRGVSLHLDRGEVLGLVGESGCGKSVTASAILNLLPPGGRVAGGRILFDGADTARFSQKDWQSFRGGRAAMIFQDPDTCLDPYYPVGRQLTEALRAHRRDLNPAECSRRAAQLLEAVGIGGARRRMEEYPHQFSGGMRQRVMIAMALITQPDLLIADEPTTALDVTVQAQIMDLLRDLQKSRGMSILFITHDLALAAELCGRLSVIYAGRVVEQGGTEDIFYRPAHPYTAGLLRALPRAGGRALRPIPGSPAEAASWASGCPFAPRCPHRQAVCLTCTPAESAVSPGHTAACHLVQNPA